MLNKDLVLFEDKKSGVEIRIEEDQWNTKVFGLKMGNLTIKSSRGTLNFEDILAKALAESKLKEYRHLTCKVDTSNNGITKALEKEKFYLVDTLVTYRFYFRKSVLLPIEHQCILDDCLEKDLPHLKKIARKSFEIDRFHTDEALDNQKCDEYYDLWIENSYNGFADKVIVAQLKDEPVGFTTGKLPSKDGVGQLVLSAVSDKCRGKGVYTSMIYEGVKWLSDKADCVQVGTQINNLAVQKAWIKLGFTVYGSEYIFQKIL